MVPMPARSRSASVWLLLALTALTLACSKTPPREAGLGAVRANDGSAASPPDKLLVRSASLAVEVESVPAAAARAEAIVTAAGGELSASSLGKDGPAHLSLRVPAASLAPVLDQLAALGKELRRSVSTQDVTEGVRDLEAELANARALRDRLRALLARAEGVKDVLAVETELARIQTRIDTLEGRLAATRRDVALSAVELELSPDPAVKPRRILGPLGLLWVGTTWVIEKLFVIRY
jgi:hypothetical protein